MAVTTVLFVSPEDVIKNTNLNGNVDRNQLIQFIKLAQDIDVQNILGTNLYEALKTKIDDATISGGYEDILERFVQPMTIHYAYCQLLPELAYMAANAGVYLKNSEQGQTLTDSNILTIVQRYRERAEHYARRFIDYMCVNSGNFPEYNNNDSTGMYPDKSGNWNSWVL